MAAQNDITGDSIQSRVLSREGRDNWDRIFGKKEKKYKWVEQGETEQDEPIKMIWTETQILDHYYDWWSEQMTKRDKAHMINRKECIADFCVVNWAQEVK
jgi:hypothetical protein